VLVALLSVYGFFACALFAVALCPVNSVAFVCCPDHVVHPVLCVQFRSCSVGSVLALAVALRLVSPHGSVIGGSC
jgi:hypothetical protein